MFGRGEIAHDAGRLALDDRINRPDPHRVDRSAAPLLQLRGVATAAQPGECAIRDISFDLWPGEVMGIAGVDGNGQKHLAEVLSGQRPRSPARSCCAHWILHTAALPTGAGWASPTSPTNVMAKEPSEHFRSLSILSPRRSVHRRCGNIGLSRWGRIHRHAREQIDRHDIRTPSERTPIAKLSGGNIQKVLLARELTRKRPLLSLTNRPTVSTFRIRRSRASASSRTPGAAWR